MREWAMTELMYVMHMNEPFWGYPGINLLCKGESSEKAKKGLQKIIKKPQGAKTGSFMCIGFIGWAEIPFNQIVNVCNVDGCSKSDLSAILLWGSVGLLLMIFNVLRFTSKYINSEYFGWIYG